MANLYFYAPFPSAEPDGGLLSNWYIDEALTIQATNFPTSSDDIVILTIMDLGPSLTVNNCIFSDGTSMAPMLTVLGVATFYGNSYVETLIGNAIYNDISFTQDYTLIIGNAIFNDYSINNGNIDGSTIFNDNANNSITGIVNQNTIFNGNSYNDGGVIGTADNDPLNEHNFNNSSYNAGIIYGNSYFNDSSFAYPIIFGTSYSSNPVFQNRTPYPLKRGVNSSSLLAVV